MFFRCKKNVKFGPALKFLLDKNVNMWKPALLKAFRWLRKVHMFSPFITSGPYTPC